MKKIFSLVLLAGMLALMSFSSEKNNPGEPGSWDWCDGYARGVSMILGLDDWEEAEVFEACMGIEYGPGWE